MNLKNIIRRILEKLDMLDKVKEMRTNFNKKRNLTKKYKFENRMKKNNKVCIILAGYKEFLWDIVFLRIKKFIPNDIDVCILSSGKYSEKLSKIAKQNNWSYLSTKRNNVSLIQNIAINLFKSAEFIYKLDEDIFVTDGYFETLMKTYEKCRENGEYRIGFIAPTIPINGFGHMNILKRFGLLDIYEKNFEKPIYALDDTRMLEKEPKAAQFFWGGNGYLPNIDEMNKIVKKDKFGYQICPIRFSIGAILFTREIWENMEFFKVTKKTDMGNDEKQLCEYCLFKSRAMIVSNNAIVGHLAFRQQNTAMKEYFINNKELFNIH